MGFNAVNKVLACSKAPPAARLILLILAQHANDQTLLSWPTLATISLEAGLSSRAVSYSISELIRLGELVVEQKGGGHRTDPTTGKRIGQSTHYRINLEAHFIETSFNEAHFNEKSDSLHEASFNQSSKDHKKNKISPLPLPPLRFPRMW